MQNIAQAKFPISLNLPSAEFGLVDNAAKAIKQEYRISVRWKRLRCQKVTPLTDEPGESIFIIEIGHSIEFDWTWEGAIAFRPFNLNSFQENIDTSDDFVGSLAGEITTNPASVVWAGEVVEVDEVEGRLYVSVSDPEHPPQKGSFYVRPFRFLEFLHNVYCQPTSVGGKETLAERLNACRGNVHPHVSHPTNIGLNELQELWQHSWAILWGPPGTGKTFTIGEQVAACLNDPTERILVVSTTNRATDEAALSIGRRCKSGQAIENGRLLRIGKSAGYNRFQDEKLEGMLRGTETEILCKIGKLSKDLQGITDKSERAQYQKLIQELRRLMKDNAFKIFVSPEVQVVISTAFKAVNLLNDPKISSSIAEGKAPFTTIVIDEAGLISRAAAAVLSLLASRRVLVVGDAKQLAPISKISRVLPTSQSIWIASSALSHLQRTEQANPAVNLLRKQYRMHPQISRLVSEYQYEGELRDADEVTLRNFELPAILKAQPRAIWYVLDEDQNLTLPLIRAERGAGNRSWVRKGTQNVLNRFFSDPEICQKRGLFLSPFKAQAKNISQFLAEKYLFNWSAATIHSQQGTEADLIIFDTVYAGSTGWPYDEWKRLINVGISRAREFVMIIASRAEMNEPYLKPLFQNLAPRILSKVGANSVFVEAPQQPLISIPIEIKSNPDLLGNQLVQRKVLRPVMSAEQQQLVGRDMDGKPRLVRGVAGSGKTVVLANWLVQTIKKVADKADSPIWAVYANRALDGLITQTIEEAWKAEESNKPFPWDKVQLLHIKDILEPRLKEVGLKPHAFGFDYDKAAETYLELVPPDKIESCCHAIFIDEAQDLGPNSLKLLTALVEQSDSADSNSRSVNIFYDNAQNILGLPTPKWTEIGLDMRGRSTIMKESFRSTKPITEFALNVLYRLQPPDSDDDHKELVKLGLIEKGIRNGEEWWDVRFNQVGGPIPNFHEYKSLELQIDGLGDQLVRWIQDDAVMPSDICIIFIGDNIEWRLETQVAPKLKKIGANLRVLKSKAIKPEDFTVIATTPNSFKGYDSEIIVVAAVEQFRAKGKGILANSLYVAMTRARSVLSLYAQNKPGKLLDVIKQCWELLPVQPKIEKNINNRDEFEEVAAKLGSEHQDWLGKLWEYCSKNDIIIDQGPIIVDDGEILAEPLFWLQEGNQKIACFGSKSLGTGTRYKLEDADIRIINPGTDWQ